MSDKTVNIAVIGMGRGGKAILEMLEGNDLVNVVGVVETNPDAPGTELAKQMGIPVYEEWKSLIEMEGLDDIIDVTGSHEIHEELYKQKPVGVDLMGGPSAKMMWLLIEAQKATEEELRAVNQELESFTYTASHDLKEPLRSLETFSQFLIEDYADKLDDEGKDYLKRIAAGAARLRNLIDDLLALSRVSRIQNPHESVDSAELVKDALKRLKALLEEKKVKVTVDDELPHITCDNTKMKEVFYNLITNAMKYNDKPDPSIEIGTKDKETFFVKDNGKGIEAEYMDVIFKPFKRGPRAQELSAGTGVGLALVKKIVQEHGGKVWVESEVGKGATFLFTLPQSKGG